MPRSSTTARAAAALLTLPLLFGCDISTSELTGVTIPGLGVPGTNPPIFIAYALAQTGPRTLELGATAFDVDPQGLTITYAQLSGPLAVERTSVRVAGTIDVVFDIPSDGTYVFRVIASDGFFNADVILTRTVTTPPPPGIDPVSPVGTVAASSPAFGRFSVNVTGQVTQRSGDLSFSHGAIVNMTPPPMVYIGKNPVIVQIDTNSRPTSAIQSAGGLTLSSQATRAGAADDAFQTTLRGKQVDLAGVVLGQGAAGLFRPGDVANGPVMIGQVDGTLVVNGNVISGVIELVDETGIAVYRAQVSGTRIP